MAARRLRMERERACDDLVLATGTRGSDYADQLLDIARVMHAGRFSAVMAGASLAMAKRSQLEGRLMAILDPSVPRRGLTRARTAAAAIAFAFLIVPVASVQPWAEERPATNAAVSDLEDAQPAQVQPPQPPSRSRCSRRRPRRRHTSRTPDRQTPTTAANAARENRVQGQVQDTVQGAVQGAIQGSMQGAIQGAVQGIDAGIRGGIQAGVPEGIRDLIPGGVIADAVVNGLAGVAHDVAVTHQNERQHEKDGQSTRDPRTVNALMEALKDSDKEVRETAMHALVQMRDPRMFEPLVAALKDASADVREQAAFGLGQLRDARAVEPLSAAHQGSERRRPRAGGVRARPARALSRRSTRWPSRCRTRRDDVREQAAFALGQIRDSRAVEPLISALKDREAGRA